MTTVFSGAAWKVNKLSYLINQKKINYQYTRTSIYLITTDRQVQLLVLISKSFAGRDVGQKGSKIDHIHSHISISTLTPIPDISCNI